MLTPAQIKEHEFKSSGRNSYKSDDVDEFIAEITVDYEKMFRENGELVKRVSLLADRLEKFKNDENDIKNAVLSAQKAAELIVKDAEESVADSKAEAEAALNAAKSEAELIKADAEKQAVADSELLLSMTRDKAQEIIQKAKEEARGIVLDAKSSAKDEMGAANRTVTSETLLYDMMKKEVSDFKASILAQYKSHIELISKLPEIAAEEAKKHNVTEECENSGIAEENESESVDTSFVISLDDSVDAYSLSDDISEESNDIEDDSSDITFDIDDEEIPETSFEINEEVVKTELPYDFFSENNEIEFIENNSENEKSENDILDNVFVFDKNEENTDNVVDEITQVETDTTKNTDGSNFEELNSSFSIDSSEFNFNVDDMKEDSLFENSEKSIVKESFEELSEDNDEVIEEDYKDDDSLEEDKVYGADIPISGGFNINTAVIENIEPDDDSDESPVKKHGFFKRKK